MTNAEKIQLQNLIRRHSKEAGIIDRGIKWVGGKLLKKTNPTEWKKYEEAGALGWKELQKAEKLNPEGVKALREVHNIESSVERGQTISDLAKINKQNWQEASKLPKNFKYKTEVTTKGGKTRTATRKGTWDSKTPINAEGTTMQQELARQDLKNKKSTNRMKKLKNFGYSALGTATLGAPVAGAYYVGSNLLTPQPSTGGFVNQDPYSQTNY